MKDIIQKIYDYSLEDIMSERFARYSKYIIQDRAIPDIRDGLKPVQRRILYSMYKEKNTHDKAYRKSARSVGDIMGKYHPHGDTSIYEAIIRMSQYWKMRETLIDMHGNNGSIDGDSPAAMRYTEARLSKIASEMLKDIDKDTVIFSPNYDDSLLEPIVLPSRFPNLLVNGSVGISAGYATNIPPHNLKEVVDATIYRINHPTCKIDPILNIVKGPDFPTGAIIEGKSEIEQAYKTGKGRIVIKSELEVIKNKNIKQIIINNIPFEVNKSNLVKQIDEIRINKKIEGILEVRDESDKEGLRICIDIKKDIEETLITNYLYKNTDLCVYYNFNMIAIVNKRPKLLGILEILDAYINHQKEVTVKRSEFDLKHAKLRQHIVEGLIKALGILDQVIETIRKSKDKQDAQENLVKNYDFTEEQANAILVLQLYKLTNTDVTLLEEELKKLNLIILGLEGILSDESKLFETIKYELKKINIEYGNDRLTKIKDEIEDIKIDTVSTISKENTIVVVTKDGYIKRVSLKSYNDKEETILKDEDYVLGLYNATTVDTVLLFTNQGNYLYLPVFEIPELKWKELGTHINNIIELNQNEKLISAMLITDFKKDEYIISYTKNGMIKTTELKEYVAQRYSKPLLNIKLKKQDEVINVVKEDVSKNTLIITNDGLCLKFNLKEVPITKLKTSGVKSISLKSNYVVASLVESDNTLTLITNQKTAKRIKTEEIELLNRARKGKSIIKTLKSNPQEIISAFSIDSRKTFVINNKDLIKNSEIPITNKDTIGTNISKSNIENVYLKVELEEDNKEVIIEPDLNDVDNKILTIDDFLKNMDE